MLRKHRRERAGYNVSRFGSSEYSISKKPIYGPLGPTSFNFRPEAPRSAFVNDVTR